MIPILLKPDNLIIKEIGGQKVKAKELVQYFKSYMKLFSGVELPEPKSMFTVSTRVYTILIETKQTNVCIIA